MATEKKTKRKSIAKRKYITDANPEGTRSASPETTRLDFLFADGTTRSYTVDMFNEAIMTAFAWHGMGAKAGDFMAEAKGDLAKAIEAFDKGTEVLRGDTGAWFVEKLPAGPRISDLVEAMAVIKGYTTEHELAVLADKLHAYTPEKRTGLAVVPNVAAEVARIRSERAVKRAAELAKVAETTDTIDDLGDFEDL